MSLLLFVAGQRTSPSVTPPADVNWPGTSIPRERFKQMQRASLAQYLADERARIEAAKEARPSVRKVKEATDRLVKQIASDGLLTAAQIAQARPLIREMMQGPTLADIQAEMDLLFALMEQAAQAHDDEAAAFLLLAA